MNISESGRVWLAPANFNYWTGTGRMFHGGSRRIVIDMSFLWRSLSASDLIKVLFSDFYSPSHSSPTPPWLQAAALIEYIASQATAADRKLWASHLSCHQFPSCIFVVRFTSPPFKILGKVLFCLVSSFLEPFPPLLSGLMFSCWNHPFIWSRFSVRSDDSSLTQTSFVWCSVASNATVTPALEMGVQATTSNESL